MSKPHPPERHVYADRGEQASRLASIVADELRAALSSGGTATLAVPGGTTPGAFLTALSEARLDWSRVTVLPTDERVVAPDDARSNARLVRETLLRNAAGAATLLELVSTAPVTDLQLAAAEAVLRARLPLDVCVLGMGDDMHTASLFPGADGLGQALAGDGGHTVCRISAPGAPEPRITLTASVLAGARHCHLLIAGVSKKAALEVALSGIDPLEAPVRVVLSGVNPVHIHYSD